MRSPSATPMQAYLSYWNPEDVNWLDKTSALLSDDTRAKYQDVHSEADIYVITSLDGEIYLLGRLTLNASPGGDALGFSRRMREDGGSADPHIPSTTTATVPVAPIQCADTLHKTLTSQALRSVEQISALRAEGMRRLTSASAKLFDELLAASKGANKTSASHSDSKI